MLTPVARKIKIVATIFPSLKYSVDQTMEIIVATRALYKLFMVK